MSPLVRPTRCTGQTTETSAWPSTRFARRSTHAAGRAAPYSSEALAITPGADDLGSLRAGAANGFAPDGQVSAAGITASLAG
jgi:hypothetical protein